MAKKSPEIPKTIHYIIAVHGIGEQRKNETVLPVISQFAAARHNESNHTTLLTLGLLASQSTDTNWIELENIPSSPDSSLTNKPWRPQAAANPHGKNLRFLDFVWSDVTREQHPEVGQTVKVWSGALVNRLKLRKELGVVGVDWIINLLETMQDGILLIQAVLNMRAQSVSNLIFNDFLGDVELYGDFPNTRGRAVRLFHEMMAKLHADHKTEFGEGVDPQYTIIAHSLGTVMTLDAILYAHANQKSRESSDVSDDPSILHFPGYDGAQFSYEHNLPERLQYLDLDPHARPSVEWVRYLSSYVTLGSPIDKYLALWTENYQCFNNIDWFDKDFTEKSRSAIIRHFNYSDEQDPVGYELNILESTPVWQKLMEKGEDIVFARYAMPGVAHVKYWNDYELFRRILDVAIDKRSEPLKDKKPPQGYYTEWFDKRAFIKALLLSYVAVPSTGWLVATISLETFINGLGTGTFPWLSLVIFVVTLVLTHILMKLVIKWRLSLVISRGEEGLMLEKKERQTADRRFRKLIYGTPILWGLLLSLSLLPVVQDQFGKFLNIWLISLGLAFIVSCDIASIYINTHRQWGNLKKTMAKTFSEYCLKE